MAMDLDAARKRLTDLAEGLRTFEDPEKNVVYDRNGRKHKMSELQAKVFKAYARQIERVVDETLTD